jgi:hypothetical protein
MDNASRVPLGRGGRVRRRSIHDRLISCKRPCDNLWSFVAARCVGRGRRPSPSAFVGCTSGSGRSAHRVLVVAPTERRAERGSNRCCALRLGRMGADIRDERSAARSWARNNETAREDYLPVAFPEQISAVAITKAGEYAHCVWRCSVPDAIHRERHTAPLAPNVAESRPLGTPYRSITHLQHPAFNNRLILGTHCADRTWHCATAQYCATIRRRAREEQGRQEVQQSCRSLVCRPNEWLISCKRPLTTLWSTAPLGRPPGGARVCRLH